MWRVKRVLLGLAGLVLLALAGRALVRALASDETRIRWLVGDAVHAFNETHTKGCLAPLADEWRHQPYGVDRELLKAALVRVFFQAVDPETKAFLFEAEVDTDAMTVQVAEDGRTATIAGEALFSARRGDALDPTWRVRFSGELEKDPEKGWLVVRSAHENVEGTGLARRM